jgi:hypothetical protein
MYFKERGKDDIDWLQRAKDNPMEICCRKSNGSSSFIKGGELIDKPKDHQLLKKNPAPCGY